MAGVPTHIGQRLLAIEKVTTCKTNQYVTRFLRNFKIKL